MTDLGFQLFGIPVAVRSGFFLMLGVYVLFALQARDPVAVTVAWCAVVFVSVLLHELGHAAACRVFGAKVHGITLHGLGGECRHAPTKPGPSVVISLAGPFAGLVVGGLVLAASPFAPPSELGDAVISQILWVNLVWSAFNLLPLRPLDGGNALLSFLVLVLPPLVAWRIVHGLGLVVALGLVAFAWKVGLVFVLLLAGSFIVSNFQALRFDPTARAPG